MGIEEPGDVNGTEHMGLCAEEPINAINGGQKKPKPSPFSYRHLKG
jgi:hypothetical protein